MKYLSFTSTAGDLTLPATGRAVVVTKNGKIIYSYRISNKHHIATLPEFLEIAEIAGYSVAVPPRKE